MRKKILAVDVDLTVVDTLTPWVNWFRSKTGIVLGSNHMNQYDIVPVMKKLCADVGIHGFDPFDFWKSPNLYDNMLPLRDSQSSLAYMTSANNIELVFVSHCVPEHESSKRLFLSKFFGKHLFVSAKDKWLVNYDGIIDDNATVMEQGLKNRPDSVHVQFQQLTTAWASKDQDGRLFLNSWSDFSELDKIKYALLSKK